jgi:hypothetical protein
MGRLCADRAASTLRIASCRQSSRDTFARSWTSLRAFHSICGAEIWPSSPFNNDKKAMHGSPSAQRSRCTSSPELVGSGLLRRCTRYCHYTTMAVGRQGLGRVDKHLLP